MQSKIFSGKCILEKKYLKKPLLLFIPLRQKEGKPALAGDDVFVNSFKFLDGATFSFGFHIVLVRKN